MSDGEKQVGRLLEAANIRQLTDLARLVGKGKSTLTMWKKRGVPENEVYRLASVLNCEPRWIETGEGPMRAPLPHPNSYPRAVARRSTDRVSEGQDGYISSQEKELLDAFRKLDDLGRSAVLNHAVSLAEVKESRVKEGGGSNSTEANSA